MPSSAVLVILLGILSTTQNHFSKALERQGIGALDLIRAKLRRTGGQVEGKTRDLPIYLLGVILNHTVFIYHLLVAPLGGTTALYTSMYGTGLVALLLYTKRVMKERVTRLELAAVAAILLGTLTIGIEGVYRPSPDMSDMDVGGVLAALLVVFLAGAALIALGLRNGSPEIIGLAFGLGAGACGALDPFLKGLGQAAGGGGRFVPQSAIGWALFISSFFIGEVSFLVTQWGFFHRARASVLVPVYNCSYVAVPVVLQTVLLPGYALYWITGIGLGLIMLGFILMRGFGRGAGEAPAAVEGRSG